jgi:hypothetical protein
MPIVLNPLDRGSVDITGTTKTLAEGDNGVVQVVKTAGTKTTPATVTVTLPATVVGTRYTIVNGAQADQAGNLNIAISPAAVDKIMGAGFTSVDNKDAILTLGRYGDFISLVGDGVNGYFVDSYSGNWTREA